jgi:S1-C subfamily serine protease
MKATRIVWITLLALCWTIAATAQPAATPNAAAANSAPSRPPAGLVIVTRDGKTYKNVEVKRVAPDGLLISYAPDTGGVGISKLKFTDLPDDLQRRYGFNRTNAVAFEKAERQSTGQMRAQLIAADKAAEASHFTEELSDALSSARVSGTGFFITSDGYMLTCFHVVTNAARIVVGTRRGVLPAQMVQSDEDNDIALLKVEGNFTALPLAVSNSVNLGESVFTIGFPNPGVQGLQVKVTRGEISSLAGIQDDPTQYQVSAPAQPGNSGGALVDEYGNVAGIVVARLSDEAALATSGMLAQNVNYAIKSYYANGVLQQASDLTGKLKSPHPSSERRLEDVVREAQDATALVICY